MRYLPFICCLLLLWLYPTRSLYANVDSLRLALEQTPIDSNKVKLINDWSYRYRKAYPAEALSFLKQGVSISQRSHYVIGEISCHLLIGIIKKTYGDYQEAAEHYFSALRLAQSIQNISKQSSALNNIGSIFQAQNQLAKALTYYKQTLALERQLNNQAQISIRLYNIGTVYEQMDSIALAHTYYYNSLLIEQELNNREGIFYALYGIAGIEIKRKEVDKAFEHLEQAKRIATEDSEWQELASVNLELGKLYSLTGQYPVALATLAESLRYAERSQTKNNRKEAYLALATTYAKMGNYKDAFEYRKKYDAIKDSINGIAIGEKIVEYEKKLEIEKKESEIKTLRKDAELQAIRVNSSRRNRYMLLTTCLFGFALAFSNLWRIQSNPRFILQYLAYLIGIILTLTIVLFYSDIYHFVDLSYANFLLVLVDVLSVMLLPSLVGVLVFERILINRHIKKAQEFTQELKSIEIKAPVTDMLQEVQLTFDEKSDLKLATKDLICLQANDNYINAYYLKGGLLKKEIFRGTLKSIEEQLSAYEDFVRCHKSFIINIKHLKSISGNAQGYRLDLEGIDFDIPVSRKFPKDLIEMYKNRL